MTLEWHGCRSRVVVMKAVLRASLLRAVLKWRLVKGEGRVKWYSGCNVRRAGMVNAMAALCLGRNKSRPDVTQPMFPSWRIFLPIAAYLDDIHDW